MKRITYIAFYCFLLALSQSCGNKSNEQETSTDDSLILLTQEQFNTAKMELGKPVTQTFEDAVHCKGYLFAPTNSSAIVSTPLAGQIKSLNINMGDYVSSGQVICHITGSEFLQVQQDFAEAAARYNKYRLDYERVKALRQENIGAEKDLISVRSDYRSATASYNALKARIQALHLSTEQIENGKMYNSFPVTSPISGYITSVDAKLGQFADMSQALAQVVNTSNLQLKLSVFESDIDKLMKGQTVQFTLAQNPSDTLRGKMVNIGKAINPDNKTVECMASITTTPKMRLINDSYVQAAIRVNDFEAKALPITSLHKEDSNYFVYVVEKKKGTDLYLKKIPVTLGKTNAHFVEIKSELPANDVVVKGIETLQ